MSQPRIRRALAIKMANEAIADTGPRRVIVLEGRAVPFDMTQTKRVMVKVQGNSGPIARTARVMAKEIGGTVLQLKVRAVRLRLLHQEIRNKLLTKKSEESLLLGKKIEACAHSSCEDSAPNAKKVTIIIQRYVASLSKVIARSGMIARTCMLSRNRLVPPRRKRKMRRRRKFW